MAHPTDHQDGEILTLFAQPATREQAFTLLVRKYQQRLYWHIRKMVIDHDDANDVTQETFVKVWHNLANFRAESRLYTWLYRIATNECLQFLEKKRRQRNVPLDDVDTFLIETLYTGSYIDGDSIQLQLQEAILHLPEKQRLVFNMKYFDDLKYEDISEITGTSVGALKASYHHAVKKIEQRLQVSLNQ